MKVLLRAIIMSLLVAWGAAAQDVPDGPATQPADDAPDAAAVETPPEPAIQVLVGQRRFLLVFQTTVHTVFGDRNEQSLRQILVLPIETGPADAEGNVPFAMSIREIATENIANGQSQGDYVIAPGHLAQPGNSAAYETLTFSGTVDRFNRVTDFQMAHQWVELGIVDSPELDNYMHAVHDLVQSGFRGALEAALAYIPPADAADGETWIITRPGFCPVAYMETGALRVEAHGWAEQATCTLESDDVAREGTVVISAVREPLYDPNDVGVTGDYTPMPTARAPSLLTEGEAAYSEDGDVRIELTSNPIVLGDMGIVLAEAIQLFRLPPTASDDVDDPAADAADDVEGDEP